MSQFLEKCCYWGMHCFPRSSRGTRGARWFVCLWDVCVRYLAVWVSTWTLQLSLKIFKKQTVVSVTEVALWVLCMSSRWRCQRWILCCHSWRRWAAPAATRCHTPRLQSALLACSIREHRVSLCLYSPVRCPRLRASHCQLKASVFIRFLLQVILSTTSFRGR